MAIEADGVVVSRDKSLLSIDRVCELLAQTYWAGNRGRDGIETSIKNSICYGIYKDGYQVGFARVVTDYATIYWLADVIIDEAYRHKGLGKILVKYITETDELKDMRGILRTRDAHGLYEQYGFVKDSERFMIKGG